MFMFICKEIEIYGGKLILVLIIKLVRLIFLMY